MRGLILKFIPGRTWRERIAGSVAICGGVAAFCWAMFNDMGYGWEGEGNPSQLWTSGRFEGSTVLTVFYICIGVSAVSALLFRYFRFRDNLRHAERRP